MPRNLKTVLFHALCLWGLTFLGGFVVGFYGGLTGQQMSIQAIGVANIVIIFAGVFYYCLIKRVSWRHFAQVFVALFLFSLLNVVLFGVFLGQVIIGTMIIAVVGAVAKVFADLVSKKDDKSV